jgi:hypothetical protein
VDDDSRKWCVGNVEENSREGVDGEQDNQSRDDTSERGAHTGFRFDGRSRERTSRWISSEKGPEDVRDSDGDQFLQTAKRFNKNWTCSWELAFTDLGRVDGITIDTAE